MAVINLITGLVMMGMGFFIKSYPNLISGYNTLNRDKKKNVDIDGLSTYMRNSFVIIGLSIIVGYYVFNWIGFTVIADSMILIVTLTGVTIVLINAQRFDQNQNKNKKTKHTLFFIVLVIVSVIGLLAYGYIPAKAIIDNDNINFIGMYGFEISVSEIDNIELSDSIPALKMRTNGFSLGVVDKGFYNLDKFGKTRLLVHSDNPPFLIISKSSSEKIIFNFRDKTKTERMFGEIKNLINK